MQTGVVAFAALFAASIATAFSSSMSPSEAIKKEMVKFDIVTFCLLGHRLVAWVYK